jgi:hypothetical protein
MPDRPLDYQGNSHKLREGAGKREQKPEKFEPVVKGEVKMAKKSFGQKFKGVFFGGEFRNAMRYVTAEVLLPALRNLMVDTTTKGVERMVYGESTSMRRRPTAYGSRTQYSSPMRRDAPYIPDQRPIRQVRRDTNDVILANRDEAEQVLERLIDIVDKYDVASVADLYDLLRLPSSPVDNKWGWTYLNTTEIRQVRDGYLLDLPPAEEI